MPRFGNPSRRKATPAVNQAEASFGGCDPLRTNLCGRPSGFRASPMRRSPQTNSCGLWYSGAATPPSPSGKQNATRASRPQVNIAGASCSGVFDQDDAQPQRFYVRSLSDV